jgi:cytochrome c556
MNKEEFKAKASQTVDLVSARINELKAKKESVKEEAKAQYNEAIDDLESRKSTLERKYAELENASEDKWEDVKETFITASDSLNKGFSKLKSLLAVLVLLLFMASCGSSDTNDETTMDDVQEEMNDVVDVSRDLATEKWEDLNQKVADIRSNIEARGDRLENQYNSLSKELQNKYKNQKQKMDQQMTELESKLEAYQAAANEEKEALEAEIDQLNKALEESYATFEQEMKDEK